jgi:hypothetical protein
MVRSEHALAAAGSLNATRCQMPKPLYQLFTFTIEHGWQPQFSDRDRKVVVDEERDGYRGIPRVHRVILKLADDSADSLEYAQRMLNKHGRNIRVS